MGCSRRVKKADLRPEQKWDFISLGDFKSTSCLAPLAYGYLWVSLIISTAVYAVDTFTAVNLLAFNKWSGEVQPIIPLDVSKWIFSGCIIASWVNLGFEQLRALRVMRRGAVAECFLDNLAVRLECIRLTDAGKGWKRFLVFAELTKSKKGTEYVALFTYFGFQAWIRIIFCQGPRQVINALTLYSVFTANLDPSDSTDAGSFIVTFFKNIDILAEKDNQQAVILAGMLFTLTIWVFGALSLILSGLFYILFLWHYIPTADNGLSGYCERKINQRLTKIVSAKINKALEEDERRRIKAEQKAAKKGEKPPTGRQATIPTLFDADYKDDKLPGMPMGRTDTMTTLPVYQSRPGTAASNRPPLPGAAFELGSLNQKPSFDRNASNNSNMSYGSDAGLLSNASDMGYGRNGSLTSQSSQPQFGPPPRSLTGGSINSNPQNRGPRLQTPLADRGYTQSPASFERQPQPTGYGYGPPMPRLNELQDEARSFTPTGPAPSMGRRTPFDPVNQGRSSPAPFNPAMNQGRSSPMPFNPAMNQGRSSPMPFNPALNQQGRSSPMPFAQNPNGRSSPAPGQGQYQSYQPQQPVYGTNPTPDSYERRNVTDPGGFRSELYGEGVRPGTAGSNRGDAQGREWTGGPQQGGGGYRR